MSRRFNPPPGWPPAPEGFEPPPGWQPDPRWPPPPGWQFWVDDFPFGFAAPPPAPRRPLGRPVVLVGAAVAAVVIGGAVVATTAHYDTAAPRIAPDATRTPTPVPTAPPSPPAGVAPTEVPTVTPSTASGSPGPEPSVTEVGDLPVAAVGDCWRRKGEDAYEAVGCTRAHVAQVFALAAASPPDAYRRAKKPVRTARQQAQVACRSAERTTRLTTRGEKSDVAISMIYPEESTLADPKSTAADLQIVCLLKLGRGTTTSALMLR